jgi:hypothetical protein
MWSKASMCWFSKVPLLAALAVCHAADSPPRKLCEFAGFENPKIAIVASRKPVTVYFGCSPDSKCIAAALRPGDPLVIYGTEGNWTCGYHADAKGAAPVWAPSSELRPVEPDTMPSLDAWLGQWRNGEDHVTIKRTGNELQMSGDAVWHGLGQNVHTGEFSGTATPEGNRVHYVEGECTIDFALVGNFLVLNDNSQCGGVNVRFWGIWRRQ